MRPLTTAAALLLAGIAAFPFAQPRQVAGGAAPVPATTGLIVGTFDSRAVAIAYVRSDAFDARLKAMRAELSEAQTAGNDARVAELETLGQTMQSAIHQQGFGTAPVDDILATIEERLPAIAEEAGVDVIVSKWALAWERPGAAFVDMTRVMAGQFDPDDETLEVIRQVLDSDPVPAEQLSQFDD